LKINFQIALPHDSREPEVEVALVKGGFCSRFIALCFIGSRMPRTRNQRLGVRMLENLPLVTLSVTFRRRTCPRVESWPRAQVNKVEE